MDNSKLNAYIVKYWPEVLKQTEEEKIWGSQKVLPLTQEALPCRK